MDGEGTGIAIQHHICCVCLHVRHGVGMVVRPCSLHAHVEWCTHGAVVGSHKGSILFCLTTGLTRCSPPRLQMLRLLLLNLLQINTLMCSKFQSWPVVSQPRMYGSFARRTATKLVYRMLFHLVAFMTAWGARPMAIFLWHIIMTCNNNAT